MNAKNQLNIMFVYVFPVLTFFNFLGGESGGSPTSRPRACCAGTAIAHDIFIASLFDTLIFM